MNSRPTVSDTKRAFYSRQTRPVNSVFRRVIEELLVEMHLLRVNDDFRYDAIYALGIVSSFDNFMEGYEPSSERDSIFNALVLAEEIDPQKLRADAKNIHITIQDKSYASLGEWFKSASTSGNGEFEGQVKAITDNHAFKYSRLFGIGLFTMLQAADDEASKNEEKVKEYLTQLSEIFGISNEKLIKDIDFYRANLEKVQQARATIAEIIEADRKREAQRQAEQQAKQDAHADGAAGDVATSTDATSESEESSSTPSS